MPEWSDDELEALAAIPPGERRHLADFREKFPRHSAGAVRSKLVVLRARQIAADTVQRPSSPFPKFRFD